MPPSSLKAMPAPMETPVICSRLVASAAWSKASMTVSRSQPDCACWVLLETPMDIPYDYKTSQLRRPQEPASQPRNGGQEEPKIIAVCGTSMDAGKTYTAMSLIIGLRRQGYRVAAIKLTGTATGSDRWSMLDAGACEALDFIDGGWPATYLCTVDELMNLYHLLISHVSTLGVDCVVIEISDGLLQPETEALLQVPNFTAAVSAWVLAAGDPLGAVGGVSLLRQWQIEPFAVSGIISMSALGIREVQKIGRASCLNARQLQSGDVVGQHLKVLSQSYAHIAPNQAELAKV